MVPHLAEPGGVGALARFVRDIAVRCDRYELKIVSLSTAFADPCNLSISRPPTWLRGAQVEETTWEGARRFHVGSIAGELEFQRFRPRPQLTRTLADCDLIQVVSGVPAWAHTVCGIGKPVAVQSATTLRAERAHLAGEDHSAKNLWMRAMTRVIAPLDEKVLRTVDAIHVYNPSMLDLAKRLNRGRAVDIRYAPPGIDVERYSVVNDATSTREPYFLCVGRLHDSRKNIGLLADAFARLPSATRARYKFVLAGASEPPPSFWERAEALGVRSRFTFVKSPSIDELIRLYQLATLFVLPSHEEGFGVVLLEAMACGIPVISTRSGGPEGIITDGVEGKLVGFGVVELAESIESIASAPELRSRMSKNARATVERTYSKEAAAKPYLESWESMLRRSSPKT